MVVLMLSYSIRVMDPNSSLGKICLGENIVEISSDKVEGSGDWNSLEFQDTANSGQKKETKAMVFYQMDTEEVIKLCLEHEVKRGNKVVKKELIVALRDIEEEEKSLDDWDHLLDFNLDDIPLLGEEELPPFVCKIGKSNRNKKRSMENLSLFYQDIGTSSSAGGHLTQEEAAKEALAIRISQKFALLEELDGKIVKKEEEAIKRIKGEALKEKVDPRAFIFPIRLEWKVNENALADTGSDINTMPYRIYKTLGREEMKRVDIGITMINHTQTKAMGMLTNVLCQVGVTTIIAKFLILDIPIDCDAPIVTMGTHDDEAGSSRSKCFRQHKTVEEVLLPQVHHEFLLWEGCNRDAKSRMGCDGEIDDMLRIKLREAKSNEEIFTYVAWIRAFNINEP
ncbi:retrotransposon ORF1, partial [Tanacetum coccineum]